MPTIRANGLDIAYEAVGAGPPLVLLHAASSSGRADFARPDPAPGQGVPGAPARRARARRYALGSGRGLPGGWLVDDLAAFVDALGLETLPPARLLDGRDDRPPFAAVRHPERLRTLVAGRHLARARAARQRRPPAAGSGADRARRSGLGGAARAPPRPGPGRGSLAAAAAGHRRRRREPAAAHAARAPRDRRARRWCCAATATRSCRSTRPGGSPGSSATAGSSSRPTAATRCCPSGPAIVQRGPRRVLSFDQSRRARTRGRRSRRSTR